MTPDEMKAEMERIRQYAPQWYLNYPKLVPLLEAYAKRVEVLEGSLSRMIQAIGASNGQTD